MATSHRKAQTISVQTEHHDGILRTSPLVFLRRRCGSCVRTVALLRQRLATQPCVPFQRSIGERQELLSPRDAPLQLVLGGVQPRERGQRRQRLRDLPLKLVGGELQ
jgi:hypothetical protein